MVKYKTIFNPYTKNLQKVPVNDSYFFKEPAQTINDLPLCENGNGDCRLVIEENKIYVWNDKWIELNKPINEAYKYFTEFFDTNDWLIQNNFSNKFIEDYIEENWFENNNNTEKFFEDYESQDWIDSGYYNNLFNDDFIEIDWFIKNIFNKIIEDKFISNEWFNINNYSNINDENFEEWE